MKKFLKEFKSFALKGNVMTLAIGVIIAAAFQKVVSSFTENILSPILGLFSGQNFDSLQIEIFGTAIKYGAFITSIIDFLIMALVIFILMRIVNSVVNLGRKPEKAAPTVKKCPYCLSEININATRCPHCTSSLNASQVN